MEVKNEYYMNKKILSEAVWAEVTRNRLVDFCLAIILAGIAIVVCILKGQAGEKIDWKIIVYFVCAAILIVMGLTHHMFAANKRFQKYLNAYKTPEWRRTVTMYANRIETFDRGKHVETVKFTSITTAYETKNLYVFMNKKTMVAVFTKNPSDYKSGSIEEVKAYYKRMKKFS